MQTVSPLKDKSIAVLPFVNMSSDMDNEYFSDGITEEIINALTTVRGLKVIARTSSFAFKGKNIDVRSIGEQLGVVTILEGSVRKSHQKIRVTAQLIDVADGAHLWSKNFDREESDIFALQDEISLLIADQIRANFGHLDIRDHLVEASTTNMNAYNLYLKARYHHLKWNQEDLLLGVKYYEEAISEDPAFAQAYFGAAICHGINAAWGFEDYQTSSEKAVAQISQGLQLNEEKYLGHFASGTVELWSNWDFKKAYHSHSRANELNPSFTDAEEALAEICTALGLFDRAIGHTDNMLSRNPLSPNHFYTKANIFYLKNQYDKAIQLLRTGLEIDPGFSLAVEMISVCYILQGDYKNLSEHMRVNQLEHPAKCLALFKLVNPERTVELDMEEVKSSLSGDRNESLMSWNLYIHVYLGQTDLALGMIEEAFLTKKGQLINFAHDPLLESLHSEERFQTVRMQMLDPKGFPDFEEDTKEDAVTSTKKVISSEEVSLFTQELTRLFEEEEVFLDSNLALRDVATELDVHPNKLSLFLNESMGKNFSEYVNTYRLNFFKESILDPKNKHVTILGMAYDSGFNSKTAFNAYFKKKEGLTPKSWLKEQSSY